MKYIGIDLGSSFIKSALLDLDSCSVVEQKNISAPQTYNHLHLDRLCFEIPAERMVEIVKDLLDSYTSRYDEIRGIVMGTQMHGFVYSTETREDTYISWQDMRCLNTMKNDSSKTYIAHLQEMFTNEEMTNSGVYIKPSLGMCNLYTLLNANDNIPIDGELFTIGSYVISRLTGNNICHISNAAPWGIVDVKKKHWNLPVIKKAGLDKVKLPKLVSHDFEVCGTYCSNEQMLKVYPDFGDQQVAVLGCLLKEDDVVINIATGSQVSCITKKYKPGEYESRPYFESQYLNTISNMPSGRNLDVLIKFLQNSILQISGQEVSTSQVWNAIFKDFEQNSDGITVDTLFYSTPKNMNGGNINGINNVNFNLTSLFSAAFENMAQTYWKNIDKLCGGTDKVNELVCAGGVSWKNPQLRNMISTVSGRPIRLSPIPDESLSGLFRLALVCEGICHNLSDKPELVLMLKGVNING